MAQMPQASWVQAEPLHELVFFFEKQQQSKDWVQSTQ